MPDEPPDCGELVRLGVGEVVRGGEYPYSCTNARCSETIYGVRIVKGGIIDSRCPVCLEPGLPGTGPEGTGLKLRTVRGRGVKVDAMDAGAELELPADVAAELEQRARREQRLHGAPKHRRNSGR